MRLAVYLAATATFVGCSTPRAPTTPDWSARIQDANEQLLNQGNIAVAPEMFAGNYVVHQTSGDVAGGPELIGEFVSQLRAAFPDLHVEVQVLATEGNRVAWLRTHRGTHQADFMGVPASGRVIEWQDMIVTRYDEDGLVAEEWGVSDLGERLRTP